MKLNKLFILFFVVLSSVFLFAGCSNQDVDTGDITVETDDDKGGEKPYQEIDEFQNIDLNRMGIDATDFLENFIVVDQ